MYIGRACGNRSRTLLKDIDSFEDALCPHNPLLPISIMLSTLDPSTDCAQTLFPPPASIGDPIGKGFRQRRGGLDVLDHQGRL